MRKFLTFLSSIFIVTIIPLNIIGYGSNSDMVEAIKTPDWVFNMDKNNENEIQIGYDHYQLINKLQDKEDPYQQKDWIDLTKVNDLYLYLPNANNIDQAIENINIDDSAETWTINVTTPVTWKKINNTTYTNETFITQDTTVAGIALMDVMKFDQIKNSNIFNTWTAKEKDSFSSYASLPPRIDPGSERESQNWWNANGWEKLLSEEKNLVDKSGEKFSQLDLYNKWISQMIIGMNVPLSLIEKESFILQETVVKNIFRFQSTPKQVWIDNTGNIINISTPHWGFTLEVFDQGEKIFKSPQLITLENAFNSDIINEYLDSKEFLSFNSQETTKFKDYYFG